MKQHIYIICMIAFVCISCQTSEPTPPARTDIRVTTSTPIIEGEDITLTGKIVFYKSSTIDLKSVFILEDTHGNTFQFNGTKKSENEVTYKITDQDNLEPNADFSCKLCAIDHAGAKISGNIIYFTTPVRVPKIDVLSFTSSSISCQVTFVASASGIKEKGVCYSYVNPTPDIYHQKASTTNNRESATISIKNLCGSTKYYLRPYIIDKNGTILYGSVKECTTNRPLTDLSMTAFYGTYKLTGLVWNTTYGVVNSWTEVIVAPLDAAKWTNGVYVEGMFDEDTGTGLEKYSAIGRYDPSLKCIRLYEGWAFTKTYDFSGVEGVARFKPVFYDPAKGINRTIYNGDGYDGCGEAFLVMNGDGSLSYIGANKPDGSYFANGFYFNCVPSNTELTSTKSPIVVDVSLQKTSSSYSMPPYRHQIERRALGY